MNYFQLKKIFFAKHAHLTSEICQDLIVPSIKNTHAVSRSYPVQYGIKRKAYSVVLGCHKQVEKRYWIKKIAGEIFFIKEECDPKNILIKEKEMEDAIAQQKNSEFHVPMYLCKIIARKSVFTISKKINFIRLANYLKHHPIKKRQTLRKIRRNLNGLNQSNLFPAILRISHLGIEKNSNRIILFDNSVGFPPIYRNKLVILELLTKNKIRNYAQRNIAFKFLKTKNMRLTMPKPVIRMANQLRIDKVSEELKQDMPERSLNEMKQELAKKIKTIKRLSTNGKQQS